MVGGLPLDVAAVVDDAFAPPPPPQAATVSATRITSDSEASRDVRLV
jgi:hypothetical protein